MQLNTALSHNKINIVNKKLWWQKTLANLANHFKMIT